MHITFLCKTLELEPQRSPCPRPVLPTRTQALEKARSGPPAGRSRDRLEPGIPAPHPAPSPSERRLCLWAEEHFAVLSTANFPALCLLGTELNSDLTRELPDPVHPQPPHSKASMIYCTPGPSRSGRALLRVLVLQRSGQRKAPREEAAGGRRGCVHGPGSSLSQLASSSVT